MTTTTPVLQITGTSTLTVWTLNGSDRLMRQARAQKIAVITANMPVPDTQSLLLIRGDIVIHGFVLKALAKKPGVLIAENGQAIALHLATDMLEHRLMAAAALEADDISALERIGLRTCGASNIAPSYDTALRTKADTYALRVTPGTVTEIENRMFKSVYKGSTDFVTRGWLLPARWATRLVSKIPAITPNAITVVGLLLCLYAGYAFTQGHYALGLIAGWIFMFFDTLDGKLARVTVTSSALGNFLDHGIDMVHPPFWYWFWWIGLQPPATSWMDYVPGIANPVDASVWILFGFYCLGRAVEGLFILIGGFHIHIWKKIDHWFRYITSRRNPNMVVLTLSVPFGKMAEGLIIIAAWSVLANLFHIVRLVQAFVAKSRGEKIETYLAHESAAS
jgi:hypothetical protein